MQQSQQESSKKQGSAKTQRPTSSLQGALSTAALTTAATPTAMMQMPPGMVQRARSANAAIHSGDLSYLQRSIGNHAVSNLIARDKHKQGQNSPAIGVNGGEVDAKLASEIQRAKGGGSALPAGLASDIETRTGLLTAGVRIHTGKQADTINRQLNAEAFTQGRDVFFSQGAYRPESSAGKKLLAHELTHVAQQTGPQRGKDSATVQRNAIQSNVIQRKMKIERQKLDVLAPGGEGKLSDLMGRTGVAGARRKDTDVGKMHNALTDYWATRAARTEATLLEIIVGVADTWLQTPANQSSKKFAAINELFAAAKEELPKAQKQATYLDDLSKGQKAFDYLSNSVGLGDVVGTTQRTLKGDARAGFFRSDEENLEAARLVQKYELSDAELAAIKVYTVDDYKYINPAMEGADDRVKSQIPYIDKPKSQDNSDKGIAKAKEEGQRHGKMAQKGLKKLPDFQGNVFRGMTLPLNVVQGYQPNQLIEYSSFKSSSRDENISQDFITKELKKDADAGGTKVGVLFVMNLVEKAKDVSMFSHAPNQESEVLMLPGTRFRVSSIQQLDPLHYRIVAKQIPWQTERMEIGGKSTHITKNDKEERKKIISESKLQGTSPVAQDQTPQAVMLMGGPGSGKSSILGQVVPDLSSYVVADPDEVKSALPAYRKGVKKGDKGIAAATHGESKEITNSLVTKAVAGRRNLLYDGTGGNKQEYEGFVKNFKAAGYKVTIVMTHITIDEALQRVNARAAVTGRVVPESVVRDIYKWVPKNFPDLARVADQALLFNNMVSKDVPPRLVWVKSNGDQLDDAAIQVLQQELDAISQGTLSPAAPLPASLQPAAPAQAAVPMPQAQAPLFAQARMPAAPALPLAPSPVNHAPVNHVPVNQPPPMPYAPSPQQAPLKAVKAPAPAQAYRRPQAQAPATPTGIAAQAPASATPQIFARPQAQAPALPNTAPQLAATAADVAAPRPMFVRQQLPPMAQAPAPQQIFARPQPPPMPADPVLQQAFVNAHAPVDPGQYLPPAQRPMFIRPQQPAMAQGPAPIPLQARAPRLATPHLPAVGQAAPLPGATGRLKVPSIGRLDDDLQ